MSFTNRKTSNDNEHQVSESSSYYEGDSSVESSIGKDKDSDTSSRLSAFKRRQEASSNISNSGSHHTPKSFGNSSSKTFQKSIEDLTIKNKPIKEEKEDEQSIDCKIFTNNPLFTLV
ncbi:hypothetical protein B5S28_g3174 [[Candida] boidinii]|nr:hypothetical protein B5S28_g3174 [[Candida] boidinii]OWB62978.1 hypothetical protein B5S29_g3930 [[Candida] boidinii]OWB79901.1 hypothetical protein B5S32_g4141 [[Candida] boidinii]GMF06116.1 unnamed protein product [[Candida] boidinii]